MTIVRLLSIIGVLITLTCIVMSFAVETTPAGLLTAVGLFGILLLVIGFAIYDIKYDFSKPFWGSHNQGSSNK